MQISFTIAVILSFSILIAAIISIIKFSRIRNTYRPFIYLVWIGGVNEIVSFLLIINRHYNIINSVVYGLCEAMLLLWFFRNLGIFNKNKLLFYLLLLLFLSLWVIESFFFKDFGARYNSYFGITYSLPVVLLSITAINRILFEEKDILKNPVFWICIGMIIYFTYKIVVDMFWLYGLKESKNFRQSVLTILMFINFLCNLIYAMAILWMRKKQAFTLQF